MSHETRPDTASGRPRPFRGPSRHLGWLGRAGLTAALLCATAGCAMKSYTDPSGPRYAGAIARPPAAPCGATGFLTVVTFNVEFGRAIDRAVAVLRAHPDAAAPDVLLLQEMDPDAVARAADALGMHYVFYPGGVHPSSKRDFGTAVLSPWPLGPDRKIVLPHGAYGFGLRRSVTSATLTCGARRVVAYSVHLSAPPALTGDERLDQVRVVMSDASRADLAIIGGDFNSADVGAHIERAGYAWPSRRLPGTSRGLGRWFRFDHVFVRGAAAGGAFAAGIIEPQGASDHRAVWVRVPLAR